MFDDFAHVWTPVALARALRPGKPLSIRVAGERLVLFRGASGEPAALLDRCPHRGVALSLGRVQDGCITCPFHGWRFDAQGQACDVPWNPDAKRERLGATAIPAREAGGHVWIYTALADRTHALPALEVAEPFQRAGVHVSGFAIEWETHWTRAMENMLDWPHLPFVHGGTIGHGMQRRSDSRMDIHWEERPWGAHSHISVDGEPQPGSLDLRWPNVMNLVIPVPRRTLVLQVACVPVDERHTRLILADARDFLRSPLFDPVFRWMNRRVSSEDRAIVESSDPPEVPPPAHERSVRTDGFPLYFRKRYRDELLRPRAPAAA